ncbi:MAG TPA: hypothetical protein VIP70_07275 [Nitrososphaeraceae archaeon]
MATTTTTTIIDEKENFFDRKLDLATAGLQPYYSRVLQQDLPNRCALVIIDYLLAMKTEKNLSLNFRAVIIKILNKLSVFCHFKAWETITREDILAFLDSLRKTDAADPLHKWIGTYNLYRNVFVTFFKWLYYSDIEAKRRPIPVCIENIPRLKRKETSIYKPSAAAINTTQEFTL